MTRMPGAPRLLAATLGVLALTGCAGASEDPATPRVAPAQTAVPSASASMLPAEPADVLTGLSAPWSVVVLSDGSALVSERDSARILEFAPGGEVREVGIVQGVAPGGEGGLLGLAVSADESALYAYSTSASDNRVQRFALEGGAGARGLGAATTIIDGLPRAGIHNGGRIAFGPDGMLYVATGDAGEPGAAQDRDTLAGKILRLTAEGDIPSDNPFPGSAVYSLGHRNVQGIAWSADGRMFASEFGQDAADELNVIEPGGNYGWPQVEGSGGAASGFIDPVQEWPTDAASPSGIAVIGDTLYIANLRGRVLRAVPVEDPSISTEHYAGAYGRLRAVTEAPDGALWIVTNNTDGRGDPRDGDDRILAVDPTVVR